MYFADKVYFSGMEITICDLLFFYGLHGSFVTIQDLVCATELSNNAINYFIHFRRIFRHNNLKNCATFQDGSKT